MKNQLLKGFGLAFLLASPIWLTMSEPPQWTRFGLSLAAGVLLLLVSTPSSKAPAGRKNWRRKP